MNNNNSPQETKEEILAKRILAFPTDGEMSDEGIKRNVYAAMDDWAKQQVISFRKWMDDNKFEQFANGWYANESPIPGKQTWFTIEELYTTFINNHHSIQNK